MADIHLIDAFEDPMVKLLCSQNWETLADPDADLPDNVFQSKDKLLFTFEEEHVTCTQCAEKLIPR